jgi:hypothetical protein
LHLPGGRRHLGDQAAGAGVEACRSSTAQPRRSQHLRAPPIPFPTATCARRNSSSRRRRATADSWRRVRPAHRAAVRSPATDAIDRPRLRYLQRARRRHVGERRHPVAAGRACRRPHAPGDGVPCPPAQPPERHPPCATTASMDREASAASRW